MSKYAELDAQILSMLRNGAMTWMQIHARANRALPALYPTNSSTEWRLTDRRMQALRRAGQIKSERRGRDVVWSLSAAELEKTP